MYVLDVDVNFPNHSMYPMKVLIKEKPEWWQNFFHAMKEEYDPKNPTFIEWVNNHRVPGSRREMIQYIYFRMGDWNGKVLTDGKLLFKSEMDAVRFKLNWS